MKHLAKSFKTVRVIANQISEDESEKIVPNTKISFVGLKGAKK